MQLDLGDIATAITGMCTLVASGYLVKATFSLDAHRNGQRKSRDTGRFNRLSPRAAAAVNELAAANAGVAISVATVVEAYIGTHGDEPPHIEDALLKLENSESSLHAAREGLVETISAEPS